jgi:Ca2+/Na+ antiporter
MFGLVRLSVIGIALLTVVYISVSLYSRSVRREKLERKWAQNHPHDHTSPARTAFIKRGLRRYDASIRRRLILLVYVIPVTTVAAIIYVVNFM